MNQTPNPDGTSHRANGPIRHGTSSASRRRGGPRLLSLVAGSILCVVALVFVGSGALALWKDRVDRDSSGLVPIGSTELKTDQYAVVGDLQGDGPHWLYGSTVLGEARVRATSNADQPLFMGIARKGDVLRYLRGTGYATVYSFEVSDDTTHPGGPPTGTPSSESFWSESTQGIGQQTLRWTPQAGDWSIVFMNADASANVDVRGDASTELPVLPWVAGGLLILGAVSGVLGTWILLREVRRGSPSPVSELHRVRQNA